MVDPLVALVAREHSVTVAKVLGVQDHTVLLRLSRENLNLHLDIRIDADIKYLAMLGEPGIGPAAVIANADGAR